MKKTKRRGSWLNYAFTMVALVIVFAMCVDASAATTISGYTYESLAAASYEYSGGESGSVTVSGDTFTLTAAGSSGCSGSACTTTLTITPKENVKITATVTSGSISAAVALDEAVQIVKGTPVTFTIEAAKGESASGTLKVVLVADDTNTTPEDCARYEVSGKYYYYLDEAVTAAQNTTDKLVVLVSTGSVYSSTGDPIEIPDGVTLVLPYAEGQKTVTGSGTNKQFPYANYDRQCQKNSFITQPDSVNSNKLTYELVIPSGTTVKNNGTIAVGGVLHGNAALLNTNTYNSETVNGSHSNLKIEEGGVLELKSSSSKLSAVGYVYGKGKIVANGSGATIYQPLSMLREGSTSWAAGAIGNSFGSGSYGMKDKPDSLESMINPAPRYCTQNIQCELTMAYGDYMYGYTEQHDNSCYMATLLLIGKDSGLIGLNSNTTLRSTYNSDKKSTAFTNIGKLTLTIDGNGTGGAVQGSLSLSMLGYSIDFANYPFPVPYNYDIVLENGTYTLQYDTMLLPGAGLTVGTNAELNVNNTLAVFTGAVDHANWGRQDKDGHNNATTASGDAYFKATYKSTRVSASYPYNSTLTNFYAPGTTTKSTMANLVVNGTMNVNGTLGGIVQTTGGGTVVMKEGISTEPFTRQLSLTGHAKHGGTSVYFAGASVYTFEPQLFIANDNGTGTLTTMTAGKTYSAVNASATKVGSVTFDYYPHSIEIDSSDNPYGIEEQTENIEAYAVGQWREGTCEHSNATETPEKTATCKDAGTKAYWTCGDCSKVFYKDENGKIVYIENLDEWLNKNAEEGGGLIPQLEHDYTDVEVKYTWNEDHTSCEASRTCTVCGEEGKPTETVIAKSITTEETAKATCSAEGTMTYTATFEAAEGSNWVPENDKVEDVKIPADTENGHTYGEPEFAWNEGNTASASVTCSVCHENTDNRTKLLAVEVTSSTTEGDCQTKKVTTYTATYVWNEETVTETKEVEGELGAHKWTDATCTTPKTCSVCQATEGNALGHSYGDVSYAWSEDGKTCTATRSCGTCGDGEETMTATVTPEVTIEPTCTAMGTTTYTASFNVEWAKTQTTARQDVAALDHDWADTLTQGETKHWYDCSRCDATKDAADHGYTWETTKEATCYTDGSKTGTCECGATATETIKATGAHTYSESYTTEDGKHWKKCTTSGCTAKSEEADCSDVTTDQDHLCDVCKRECSSHSYGTPIFAWNGYKCTAKVVCNCGDEQDVELEVTSEVTTTATCTVKGVETYTATAVYNGTTYTADEHPVRELDINSSNHVNKTEHTQTNATCTEIGYTAGTFCEDCKTWISGHEGIKANGHSYEKKTASDEQATEADCENAATYYVKCDNCEYVDKSQTVAVGEANGHSYEKKTVSSEQATAADCENAATYYVKCDNCDHVDKTQTVAVGEASGHSYEAVVTPPTFDAQGYTTHTCSVCKKSYVDTYVDALAAVAQIGEQKYQTLPAAVAAANAGDTVTLLADVALTERLTISKVLTLNLADKTITADFTDDFGPIYIGTQGNLTVTGNGTIVSEKDIVFANYGVITVENGTFRSDAGGDGYNAALYNMYHNGSTYGKAVINGGTFQSPVWNSGELTVVGGTLKGIDNSGKATIEGGTVNGEIIVSSDAPELAEKGTFEISGGAFQNAVEKEWCAKGYGPNANADGTYGVHQHEYDSVVTEPTCTEKGYTIHTCSVCGDSYTDSETAAKEHDWDTVEYAWGTNYSTCTASHTCKRDGCGVSETANAEVNIDTADSTCTAPGETVYTATFEETWAKAQTYKETIGQLAHSYGEVTYTGDGKTSYVASRSCVCTDTQIAKAKITPEVTKAASCTEAGVRTYTATFTETWAEGTTTTEEIAATGHTFGTAVEAKDATCEAAGNVAYKQCTVCSKYFAADAATDATDGKVDNKDFVIPQGEHSYTGAIKSDGDGKDATHSFKCVNGCDEYGNATAHTWNAGEASDGVITYTCNATDCGATYTEVIPGIKVNFMNYTTDKNSLATVTIDGEAVPYQQKTAVEATLGADGTFTVTCARACVVAYTTDSVYSTDGTFNEVLAVANDDGSYSFTIEEPVAGMTIAVLYRGDVDLNCVVNVNDAARVQRYAAKMDTNNAKITNLGIVAADVDTKIGINVNDAARIQRNAAKMDTNNAKIDWHKA